MALSAITKQTLTRGLASREAALALSTAVDANTTANSTDLAATDTNATHTVGTIGTTSGLSVVEKGDGALHKSVITLASVAIDTTDGTTPATDAHFATLPLYTFPAGHIMFLGSHMVFPLGSIVASGTDGFADDADIEGGVGTTARGNASNFQLQTAEDNIVPGQNGIDLTSDTSSAIESSQSTAVLFADGSASAIVANLNFIGLADGDAGTAAAVLTVSGTITIVWTCLGDD